MRKVESGLVDRVNPLMEIGFVFLCLRELINADMTMPTEPRSSLFRF